MIDINKVKICTMTLDDLENLKENLQTDFDDFWNFEIFKEELANTNSIYLVLKYEDEIISFGGIKIILDEADIMNIVTKKDRRNQGFANLLLNALISLAKEKKCKTITLEVSENNLPAIALYKEFDEVGRRKNYYKKSGDTAILMTYTF